MSYQETLPDSWQQQSAKYGQPECPNAPNICFCTGACNKPRVSALLSVRPCKHALGICDCNGGVCTKAFTGLARPSFVLDHNQQKHVAPAEPKAAAAPIASANPEDYYNGTQALENMITAYGKDNTRLWCVMTAHKYIERMGLKAGNSLEQEKKKCLWYIAKAEELYRELQQEATINA